MAKVRGFVITNWNLNTEEMYLKNKAQIAFVAYGDEVCPKTNNKHHQMFVYYHNPRSTSGKSLCKIGNEWGPIHCNVMPMRGSFAQNEAYCSKEGSYHKLGKEPKQGARGDIQETRDSIINQEITVDDILLENPEFYHQYGRTLREVEAVAMRRRFRTEMTQGYWYYGPTGVGKSHKAFKDYNPETHYVKNLNEDWWDGYKQQETVIINEFRGQMKFSEVLDLLDKWPKTVKWRNREPVPFTSKTVIFTSCKHPAEVFVNCQENLDQLYRRCIIEHLPARAGGE